MAPQTLEDLCAVAAPMSGAAVAQLGGAASRLPFLSDLAGADLTLFAPAQAPGALLVLAEGRPTVCRTLYGKPRTGEIVPDESEPVVARCLRSGRSQRRGFACLMGGRPVEHLALPVRAGSGPILAALGVERSLLNGLWAAHSRPLRETAASLAETLLQGALAPADVARLVRMAQGVAIVEPSGEILYADPAARRLWGRASPEQSPLRRLPPGPPAGAIVISQREEPWGREWEFEAESAVLRRRDVPLRPGDPGGNLLALLHDVSHLHAGELLVSARSAAVQEIHHRVKNNLQTISSLLRMQARRESSPQAVESLRTAIGRVLSVAFVHEALSREGADEVDLKALAGTLVEAALHGAQREGPDLTYTVLGPRLLLPAARASQVALILNELIQNAVKHAFPGGRTGAITIRFDASPDTITVCVRDDGVGLPGDFDLQKTTRLGLQITRRIVESDLGGELDISGDGGTTVTLRAPAALARPETEQP